MSQRLSYAIAVVITVVWSLSWVLNAMNPQYQAPATVGPAMLLVAGAAFANGAIRKRNGKET